MNGRGHIYQIPQLDPRPTHEEWEAREDICFSGGAIGSDYYWSWKAEKVGHKVRAFSFPGHKFTGPEQWRIPLHQENLNAALPRAKIAAMKLNRVGALSHNNYVRNLLLRNYYQVKNADRVYAIGFIDQSTGRVQGGTAWACRMFADRFSGNSAPMYFFDLEEKWWYQWQGDLLGWKACDKLPPKPEGHYAGIGTRQFNGWGRNAIDAVFNQD